MADFDNTNRGAIFVNDRKQTDKHPDWNGKLNVDGVERWVSGWIKQGRSGDFISLSLGKPVEDQQPQRTQQPPSRGAAQRPGSRPASPPPHRQSRPPSQPQGYDDFDEGPPF